MSVSWSRRQTLALHIVRALAFVGVVIVAALLLRQPMNQPKLRVEHSADRPASPTDDTATLEPEWLLSRRKELHLSRRQIGELQELQARYQQVESALARERDRRRSELLRMLDEARQRGGVSSSQLQSVLVELSQIQNDITRAKRRFRGAARSILTPNQQRTLSARRASSARRPTSPPR
jgi:hypothetical protein